jgi:hypothetical protein
MVRKTRKHDSKKLKGVYTIPELRRSFEHIEEFVDKKIHSRESKDDIVKDLRKEWSGVFSKELDKKSAEAFVSSRMTTKHGSRHRTLRRQGGMAPLDYATRQGVYLAPGQIPDKAGHLPLSDGGKSTFGSYVQYVDKGFGVAYPEIAQNLDPVPGQTRFPTSVPAGMGSNEVHFTAKGGSRRKSRKTRRGGAMRMIPASAPAGILQDMEDMWYGRPVGPSPDQVQRSVDYKLGSVYPKAVNVSL